MFISYKYTNDKQTINKHRNLTSKYVEVHHSCIKAVMSRRSRLKCFIIQYFLDTRPKAES